MVQNRGTLQMFLTQAMGKGEHRFQLSAMVLPAGVVMCNGEDKIVAKRFPGGTVQVITFTFTLQLSCN